MTLYKTILVPTDFSKYADNAIRYAHALAKANGGAVHFAHVIDQRIMDLAGMEGVYVSHGDLQLSVESMKQNAEKRMGQLIAKSKALGLSATSHICQGRPVDELATIAKKIGADLIVIATHGRSGFDRLVLGSTCERLIRESTVPVMAIKHPEHDIVDADGTALHVSRILCPCDFSDFSHKAIPHAADLCKQFGATLVLMHVVDTWLDYPEFMPSVDLQNSPFLVEKAEESLKKTAAELSGIRCEIKVQTGVPHRAITDAVTTEKIDLIVMTTHGRAGLPHFLLGSVAEKVARLAPCPVLTIRPEEKKK